MTSKVYRQVILGYEFTLNRHSVTYHHVEAFAGPKTWMSRNRKTWNGRYSYGEAEYILRRAGLLVEPERPKPPIPLVLPTPIEKSRTFFSLDMCDLEILFLNSGMKHPDLWVMDTFLFHRKPMKIVTDNLFRRIFSSLPPQHWSKK